MDPRDVVAGRVVEAARARSSRRGLLVGSARLALGGTLAGALAGRGLRATLAQDATPVPGMAGYPELKVTVTDWALEVSAKAVPAGYVLVTATNKTTTGDTTTGVVIIGPPPGKTLQDLMNLVATPAPSNGFPDFLYQAIIPGGPGGILRGAAGQAIVKLTAGDWVVSSVGNQPPVSLAVTAGTAGASQEPASVVTVTEQEFAFVGLDKPLAAGKQVWQVVNAGKQPHFLLLGQLPAGTTIDQVMQLVNLPDNATPLPGGLQFSDVHDKGGITLQSSGQTVWPVLDLDAGRYAAACFVTDPASGMPHAMEGMVALFDVGGGTPVAGTPAASSSAGSGSAVAIKNLAYSPPTLQVKAGTTVTWMNEDIAPHTATAVDKSFDSGRLDKGQSWGHAFDTPGSYAYTCTFHPAMKGTIVVT